jgi:hypothetical protein
MPWTQYCAFLARGVFHGNCFEEICERKTVMGWLIWLASFVSFLFFSWFIYFILLVVTAGSGERVLRAAGWPAVPRPAVLVPNATPLPLCVPAVFYCDQSRRPSQDSWRLSCLDRYRPLLCLLWLFRQLSCRRLSKVSIHNLQHTPKSLRINSYRFINERKRP